MGVLGYFGTENYTQRLGIVLQFYFCWFFLCNFCAQSVLIPLAHILLSQAKWAK